MLFGYVYANIGMTIAYQVYVIINNASCLLFTLNRIGCTLF